MSQLQSELKEVSVYERELSVVVPKEWVQQHLDKAYRKLSQTVKLKGFRPGKAPRDVLERYCAPQAEREALQATLEVSYQQALAQHGLEPVSEPVLHPKSTFQSGTEFCFTVQLEVKPPVQIQKWEGLELSVPAFFVSEQDVMAQLEQLQRAYATLQNVTDRSVIAQGDIVSCATEALVDEKPNKQLSMLLRQVEMNGANNLFPSVEENLLGKHIGETIQVELELSQEFMVEALRGKRAFLELKPTQIQIRQLPDLDDEFAKDISDEFQTMAELKARIEQLLQAEAQKKEYQAKEKAAIEALIAHNPVELPKKNGQKSGRERCGALFIPV